MATLTVAAASRLGVELIAGAQACAVAGDEFDNTGQEIVFLTNAGGAPVVVTFNVQATADDQQHLAITNRTVTVDAASSYAIGPFGKALYNDANGRVQIRYASVADLFVKILKATPA